MRKILATAGALIALAPALAHADSGTQLYGRTDCNRMYLGAINAPSDVYTDAHFATFIDGTQNGSVDVHFKGGLPEVIVGTTGADNHPLTGDHVISATGWFTTDGANPTVPAEVFSQQVSCSPVTTVYPAPSPVLTGTGGSADSEVTKAATVPAVSIPPRPDKPHVRKCKRGKHRHHGRCVRNGRKPRVS